MHENAKDITGERFGNLIAERASSIRDKLGRIYWICKCDCGNEILVRGDNLRSGNTSRCSDCRGGKYSKPSRFVTKEDNL